MEPYIALGKSTRSPFSDSTLVWRKRIAKSSGCAKFKGAIWEFYWVYTGINWARVFTGVYRDASGSIGCRVSTPKANMEPDTAVEGQWSLFGGLEFSVLFQVHCSLGKCTLQTGH